MGQLRSFKVKIIIKLLKRGNIGESHTSFENLPKGFPSHERKLVKKAGEKLLKDNILLSKPTSYGEEVSINPEKVEEILNWPEIIDKYKSDPFLLQKFKKNY